MTKLPPVINVLLENSCSTLVASEPFMVAWLATVCMASVEEAEIGPASALFIVTVFSIGKSNVNAKCQQSDMYSKYAQAWQNDC